MTGRIYVHNLPSYPLAGYVVARIDSTGGTPKLWYWGCFETKNRAEAAVKELGNAIMVEVEDEHNRM